MFDFIELKRQLEKAGIVDKAIWTSMEQLAYVLDAQELTKSQRSIVLQLFSSLGLEQLQRLSGLVFR